ncbi:alpha/beta fold hydrolase [Phytohabitans houttuyneae]|uniref:Alpha/beta hydrolase n=1 Tax=Phytohabitans houttuyneae TaxID=1076126 RepID=A0A6V8KL85_9ACTN|nr:alpha/beta hydrolase [Phytohabitans houttuyneae]GFJ82716.1 alpha/beta hydrolase [Phytohabitans houttuyneae]
MRRLFTALVLVLAAAGLLATPAASSASGSHGPKPTVVLVHGAFADASGWNDVIKRLHRKGYPVIAPANPLRGVPSDSAYIATVLASITGPIVLVGHSYGGIVITNAATGNPNVKALVYIAAFAPDQGEPLVALQTKFPGSRLGLEALDIRPTGPQTADGYIKASLFREIFAADLPASTTALMAATQRPGDLGTLEQVSGPPAWKAVPSWYLVAKQDQVIPAAAQRFMAERAGARTREVNASHVAMMSRPDTAADLILAAARS